VQSLRSYECAVIFAPGVNDEGLRDESQKFVNVIVSNGGEMTALETWGKRRLAYEIDHHADGHYFFFKFRGADPALTELGRQMRIDENIIRHMIVRDELASGEESVVEADKVEAVKTSEPQEG
jgi:small subunit ribosomal protein S6